MKKQFLNQLLNLVWTILCFAPVVVYWVAIDSQRWLYPFMIFSMLCSFLPAEFYSALQLSPDTGFYEKSGVRWIRKFVQNGDLVNKNSRKAGIDQNVIKGKNNIEKYLKTIDMYERYHFTCFIFFFLTAFNAAFHKEYIYSVIIISCNIFYNVFPILLQQYNRIRIQKLRRTKE